MWKSRICFSTFLLACMLTIVPANSTIAGELEEEAVAAQSARFQAMIDEDPATLSELLSDDLHYSHTRGDVETKSQFLSTIESKRIDYLGAEPRDVEVRVYGDTAVITGLSDMDLIARGERMVFTIRFLEVSRKVGSSWKLLAWQSVRFVAE